MSRIVTQPLVSVIIPTYNRADLLPRAVHSVLLQTYSNLEIIIVDDCSTDNTQEIVEAFADKRIRYICNKKNSWPCVSRNRGLDFATGEYINFLDDDDEFSLTKLEKQVGKLQSLGDHVWIVTCDVEYRRDDIYTIKKNRKKWQIYPDLLQWYCVYWTHSMLIRFDCLKWVNYDSSLPSGQEYDLMLQLAKKWVHFDYIPEKLCLVHQSRNQISFNFKKKIQGNFVLIRKWRGERRKQGYRVGIYNCARFGYLLMKYSIWYVFGKNIYIRLP